MVKIGFRNSQNEINQLNELLGIKQQLEYAKDELFSKRMDKELMYDWITDSLHKTIKLIEYAHI